MVKLPTVMQNESWDCGHAVTEAVCAAFGFTKTRKQFRDCLGTTPLDGTDPRSIETFLRRVGLRVQSGSMTLRDLKHHVTEGRPVICSVTFGQVGHYVGVTDLWRSRVYLMDPSRGECFEKAGDFESQWYDHDRVSGGRLERWGIAAWGG